MKKTIHDKNIKAPFKFYSESRKIADEILVKIKDTGSKAKNGSPKYIGTKKKIDKIMRNKNVDKYIFPNVEVKNPKEINELMKSLGYSNDTIMENDDIVSKIYTKTIGNYFIHASIVYDNTDDIENLSVITYCSNKNDKAVLLL